MHMMKGDKFMKVLKIDNKKCYYSIDGVNDKPISDISKEDIYAILNIIYSTDDYVFDEYNENVEIVNDVEKIIYANLYAQFNSFIDKKETLVEEINNELKNIKKKYELDGKE